MEQKTAGNTISLAFLLALVAIGAASHVSDLETAIEKTTNNIT